MRVGKEYSQLLLERTPLGLRFGVRNSGVREMFILNRSYRRRSHVCSFSLTLFTNRTELERIVGHIPLGLSRIVSDSRRLF